MADKITLLEAIEIGRMTGQVLEIGNYIISSFGDGFWIENDEGDGIEIGRMELLETVDNLFKDSFKKAYEKRFGK